MGDVLTFLSHSLLGAFTFGWNYKRKENPDETSACRAVLPLARPWALVLRS